MCMCVCKLLYICEYMLACLVGLFVYLYFHICSVYESLHVFVK